MENLLQWQLAFRGLQPAPITERDEGGGSASERGSAGGAVGRQAVAVGLQQGPPDLSENPELAVYRRWREGWGIPKGPLRPPPATATPPSTPPPPATATPTVPRTTAPTPNADTVDLATRIIMARVGTGKDFAMTDEQPFREMVNIAFSRRQSYHRTTLMES